jgi:hypothetical protein
MNQNQPDPFLWLDGGSSIVWTIPKLSTMFDLSAGVPNEAKSKRKCIGEDGDFQKARHPLILVIEHFERPNLG